MRKTFKLLTILVFLVTLMVVQNDLCYGVEVHKLYNEYKANEKVADIKWKGERILLYGTVRAIGKGIQSRKGQVYIDIQSGRLPGKIRCWFEKKMYINDLQIDMEVKVDGTVVGKESGFITLDKCVCTSLKEGVMGRKVCFLFLTSTSPYLVTPVQAGCILIPDSVIANSYKTMKKLDETVAKNDYTFLFECLENNWARRVKHSVQVKLIKTKGKFAEIGGVIAPQMITVTGTYWTYRDYLKCD